MAVCFFYKGLRICVFGNLDCGTLRSSGLSGTRCFSGGIVFIDVLGILDAALSRFFSLTTERVSSTLWRRNILRFYHSRTLEPSVPTLREYTL